MSLRCRKHRCACRHRPWSRRYPWSNLRRFPTPCANLQRRTDEWNLGNVRLARFRDTWHARTSVETVSQNVKRLQWFAKSWKKLRVQIRDAIRELQNGNIKHSPILTMSFFVLSSHPSIFTIIWSPSKPCDQYTKSPSIATLTELFRFSATEKYICDSRCTPRISVLEENINVASPPKASQGYTCTYT